MSLRFGQKVWVPCEVKPGAFSNERLVRVISPIGDWIGFAPTSVLKEPVVTGETAVQAMVLDVTGVELMLQIFGDALCNSAHADLLSRVTPVDAVQA
jgi:hypothetical protein